MKLNWGTSIVIAFGLFMAFILMFVFKVQGNSKYDNELVVEEYYKHDANFGDEMVKIQNVADLSEKPTIANTNNGIEVIFPEIFDPKKIIGKVSFYRPSAKKLDFEIPLKLAKSTLLIPKSDLAGGQWGITLFWKYDGKEYILKQEIYIN